LPKIAEIDFVPAQHRLSRLEQRKAYREEG
jgi:hypothetical protein